MSRLRDESKSSKYIFLPFVPADLQPEGIQVQTAIVETFANAEEY